MSEKFYLINPFTSIESDKIISLGEFNKETLLEILGKDYSVDIYEYYYQFEDKNFIEGGFIYQNDLFVPIENISKGFEVKNCNDYINSGYGETYSLYGKSIFYDESGNSSKDTIEMLKKVISFEFI